jgi:FkbH-like protein
MDKNDRMKKAIVFDCDNTLWHGVIGEDTIIPDLKIQEDIIFLANHGVIIGLCSKNNEIDVLEALQVQPLTEDYISVYRINWKDKVSNLKEIASELNIGLDDIVFVDDSPFEINMIKESLPEVHCIYPSELLKTVSKHFNLSGDFTKTRHYKEQYQRLKYQEQFTDISHYLASLDMVLSIRVNDTNNIIRISELTQKTNQFNLTTKRYTEGQIEGLMPWIKTYTLSVRDKFGDSGLTGVCMVNNSKIINFLMSCRILGRGIEYAFMDYIITDLQSTDYHIFGKYIATNKNAQVADFYDKLGFEFTKYIENEKIYYKVLRDYKPMAQNHFRYE